MIGSIFNALTGKRARLDAKLVGVSGFTGRGEIAFTVWKSGKKKIKIALRGVAGREAEIYVSDISSLPLAVDNGRVDQKFNTRNGDEVPEFTEGAHIDIHQNGEIILSGVLTSK